MELVRSIEKSLGELYAKAPHLPKNATDWMAKYAWVFALVGVIISGLSLLGMWNVYTMLMGPNSMFASQYPELQAAYASLDKNVVMVSMVVWLATVVLQAMAINPLKAMAKRGWDLMFMAVLLATIGNIITSFMMRGNGLLGNLLIGVLMLYVLFEVRNYFAVKTAKAAKTTKKK